MGQAGDIIVWISQAASSATRQLENTSPFQGVGDIGSELFPAVALLRQLLAGCRDAVGPFRVGAQLLQFALQFLQAAIEHQILHIDQAERGILYGALG